MSKVRSLLKITAVRAILTIAFIAIAVVLSFSLPKEQDPNIGLTTDSVSPTVGLTRPVGDVVVNRSIDYRDITIMVTKVKDWQKYGVVVYDEATGVIRQFAEKPTVFVGDRINAGIYIFNKSILNRIPLERTSIETQVFPAMAASGELYCMHHSLCIRAHSSSRSSTCSFTEEIRVQGSRR